MSLPDQDARTAVVQERQRNVIVDAGAGTGKTTLLVRRIIELVAPQDDELDALQLERVAAVTFTRRAAGELRLRLREEILSALGDRSLSDTRQRRLLSALGMLDTSNISTIHSFADRLLRARPIEAGLSPVYELLEEEEEEQLIADTFADLLYAAETDTVEDLVGTSVEARALASEAGETLLLALRAGISAESIETNWGGTLHGLEGIVDAFVRRRDVRPSPLPSKTEFDLGRFRNAVAEFNRELPDGLTPSPGATWLYQSRDRLEALLEETDPAKLYYEVVLHTDKPADQVTRKHTFDGDKQAWAFWTYYTKGKGRDDNPLRDELLEPLRAWLGSRLVRTFPVVVAAYETGKTALGKVDQIDLLLKLRNLLATDRSARGYFQSFFDHVFVDEFQDTDPLQAEILLYLCEREPLAGSWPETVLQTGKLTIVGDPKQSIYRFRRADIAMYDRVRRHISTQGALESEITTNFRSRPPLIEWGNERFAEILGESPETGEIFDVTTGHAYHQALRAGRSGDDERLVRVLEAQHADEKPAADEQRRLEAEALAHYIRHVVEEERLSIEDPSSRELRPIDYGDIAVLALETFSLRFLFPQLDALGVPYSSSGGRMFLTDPLHRQFILGLRAIADRGDGVAEAALLRPPFFAIGLSDLLTARIEGREPDEPSEGWRRVDEAKAFIRDLRRRRFSRPPGETARDLLEHTAFGRLLALGPNGHQRLRRAHELCLLLEQMAIERGLDYDTATARLRTWVDQPIQLDPPRPIGNSALQIMTVHQAKGLEFPVVALWDGCARMAANPTHTGAWRTTADGTGWFVRLHKLKWEYPQGLGLAKTERSFKASERKRLIYVAATRARDLFIVPKALPRRGDWIAPRLYDDPDDKHTTLIEPYSREQTPSWATAAARGATSIDPTATTDLDTELRATWDEAMTNVSTPHLRPSSVTKAAKAAVDLQERDTRDSTQDYGRFGPVFGEVVHVAIGHCMRLPDLRIEEAVARAARVNRLTEHHAEAQADVRRALATLQDLGFARGQLDQARLEYPVFGSNGDQSELLSGYIDFVGIRDGTAVLLDFKTDSPPSEQVESSHPQYVEQVRTYSSLVRPALASIPLRAGLLFSADGAIRWL